MLVELCKHGFGLNIDAVNPKIKRKYYKHLVQNAPHRVRFEDSLVFLQGDDADMFVNEYAKGFEWGIRRIRMDEWTFASMVGYSANDKVCG